MKNLMIILIVLACVSCEKEQFTPEPYNAEVLKFDSRKAYCLYGWYIKIGNDTILSFSDILRTKIGLKVDQPIKVNINAIPMDCDCKTPIYEVTFLDVKMEKNGNIGSIY